MPHTAVTHAHTEYRCLIMIIDGHLHAATLTQKSVSDILCLCEQWQWNPSLHSRSSPFESMPQTSTDFFSCCCGAISGVMPHLLKTRRHCHFVTIIWFPVLLQKVPGPNDFEILHPASSSQSLCRTCYASTSILRPYVLKQSCSHLES
jgi:hypothetical protein